MVAKSELNGAHDGRILTGPVQPDAGIAYQRLIDNCADDGCVEDLRCPTVNGEISVVFLKAPPARRPVRQPQQRSAFAGPRHRVHTPRSAR
jgi:hypothetical protein